MKESQILQNILDALGISPNFMATKLGYASPSAIYHILKGRNSFSEDMKQKIMKAYPNVSYEFMKKGTLPVILDENGTQNQMNLFSLIPVESKEYNKFMSFMKVPDDIDYLKEKVQKMESMITEIYEMIKKKG